MIADNVTPGTFRKNLLCVAPPYGTRAPAGSAYLLGYLKSQNCDEFDFLDLRLGAPFDYTPTYKTTGAFGESFVLDLPDLPLVLKLLAAFESGASLAPAMDDLFERYCLERAISPRYLHGYLASLNRYYDKCFAQLADLEFVGFSTWTPNFYSTLLAATHLKRRPQPPFIVVGGPQVTSSRASAELGLLAGVFDCVILGEGEQTLHEVYRSFRSGGRGTGIAGTVTVRDGGAIERIERKQMRLEVLPLPDFSGMPVMAYQDDPDFVSLPYQLSRGCTDKCSFCSEWVFWKHFRSAAPTHSVDQIRELLARYNANFIEFSDSLLNGHPRRLSEFCEQVLSEGLQFGWTSFMRAQIDKETATLARRSGCDGVFIGIESFSDEALALMNKRRTEADNIQAVINFVEAGIHVTAGFIPGFPGDTRRGFLHSVDVIRRLQDRYPGRIELHEEPFTLMAGAPLMNDLGASGLTGVPFAGDYLEVAPRLADVASRVLCAVEGAEQGIERIGRTKLVGAVKSDAPANGSFEEGEDDEISADVFTFNHLSSGWHLTTKLSDFLHRYAVLVDDAERKELEALQDLHYPLQPLHPDVLATLQRIEQRHVVSASLTGPRVVNCGFARAEDAYLTLSPFVVSRQLTGRQANRILVVDTLTKRWTLRPASDAALLRRLDNAVVAPDRLWVLAGANNRGRKQFQKSVAELSATGIILNCGGVNGARSVERSDHSLQPAGGM